MNAATTRIAFCLGIAVSLGAGAAQAGDGRIEIHQSCVATGCLPGDTAGFPVSLTPGSYVLTGNLSVPTAATTAITGTTDVTIDLNGFSITGVTTCTGEPAACTNTGSGDGIFLGVRGVVRNGTVRGMGREGIRGDDALVVENVIAAENGRDGIRGYGTAHQIRNIRALRNGSDGINLYQSGGKGSVVEGNTSHANGRYGATVLGAVVMHNVFSSNGDRGLYSANGAGFGYNKLIDNNGSVNVDQHNGGATEFGPNVCGYNVCP